MKRFQTVLYLLCLVCILLNISGCLGATSKHIVFADQNRTVSLVAGLSKSEIGIVLNEREFLLCESNGEVLCQKNFESRILSLDMRGRFCLFAFDDKHIELYLYTDGELTNVCDHSFDSDITKIELAEGGSGADDDIVIVLLRNGDLWRSKSGIEKDIFVLMSDHVKTAVYEDFWRSVIYIKDDGNINAWSINKESIPSEIENEVLLNVTELENSYYDSMPCVLARDDKYCYYIRIGDDLNLSMIDQVLANEITPVYAADTIPNSVLTFENGRYYYEGVSQSERKEYRRHGKHGERVLVDIPHGYSICTIKGGVVCYNDHEVWVVLVN